MELDALEAKYREAHARFALRQRERYTRFIQLLDAARGAFRSDRGMLAVLKKFSRRRSGRATSEATPSEERVHAPAGDITLPSLSRSKRVRCSIPSSQRFRRAGRVGMLPRDHTTSGGSSFLLRNTT
jgi:hypothetical protein